MPVYEFEALDARGKAQKGVRDADNPRALRELLKKDLLYLTDVYKERKESAKAAREIDFAKYFQRVSSQDVAVMTRQFAVLLNAGVPLVDALTALVDQVDKPPLKKVISQVKEAVNEGARLADAIALHDKVFDRLYVNMVNAGEQSGTLDIVLSRLADFTESQVKLKSKVIGAMVYPVVMMGVACLVIGLLVTFVVPKITAIFADIQATLPLPTRMLIGFSDFVTMFWWAILLLLGGGIHYFRKWVRTDAGRARFDAFWLRVPIFGRLSRLVAISRMSKTLSTLLKGGVPLIQAMDIVKGVVNNVVLAQVLEATKISIQEGDTIHGPLKRSGEFPPLVTHMIAVGERTGQLEGMLDNVADTYDYQVDTQVSSMTTLLEPIMILGMGLVVGMIIMAIMLPILQMNDAVM